MDNKVHISRKQKKRPAGLKKNKRQSGPNLSPCPFPIGNQYWRLRSKHGRDKLFTTPELLWEAACEYFQWCQDNPLKEVKAFAYQGEVTTAELPKMRAMTISGLCLYLHCNEDYFRQFRLNLRPEEKDFSWVLDQIEATIYNQKFQGAAADLLNASIIARELGLAEKTDHNVKTVDAIEINYIMPGEDKDQHKTDK